MAIKTTATAIKNDYINTVKISYCAAQNLLRDLKPVAYTSGAYGWNSDIYIVNNATAISTGYRPFGNIPAQYERLAIYDGLAMKVREDRGISSGTQKQIIRALLHGFLNELVPLYYHEPIWIHYIAKSRIEANALTDFLRAYKIFFSHCDPWDISNGFGFDIRLKPDEALLFARYITSERYQ